MVSNAAVASLAVHPGTVHLLAGSRLPRKASTAGDPGRSSDRVLGRTARLVLLLAAALLTDLTAYADDDRSMFLLVASTLTVILVI